MPRFNELLEDIMNQNTDNEGRQGQWIKAVKHSHLYDARHPNHPDTRGWRWFGEVTAKYANRNILIYKTGNRNWFVLPEFEDVYMREYPNARLK